MSRVLSHSKESKYLPVDDKFSTYDLGASAALTAIGYPLLGIKKGAGSKSLFLFEHSDELVEAAQRYWRQALNIDALTYFNSIKTLKNQLYSN